MKKLNQTTHINAPAAIVWDVMLSDATYRDWSKEFSPDGSGGSYFEGDWSEGSTMRFLGSDSEVGEDGYRGIESRVAANKLHAFISLEHVAVIGPEGRDTESDEAKRWTSSHENYIFTPTADGGTDLTIDMDTDEEYHDMFVDMWGRATQRIREIAEGAL